MSEKEKPLAKSEPRKRVRFRELEQRALDRMEERVNSVSTVDPVPYEVWETGETCGVEGHDADCLCDIRLSPVRETIIELGPLQQIAFDRVCAELSGQPTPGDVSATLELIASMHGVWLDYQLSTAYNGGPARRVDAQPHKPTKDFRKKVAGIVAEHGWQRGRLWLVTHGYERETRSAWKTYRKQIGQWKRKVESCKD